MFKKLLLSLVFLLIAGLFSNSYAAFNLKQPQNNFAKGEIIVQLKPQENFEMINIITPIIKKSGNFN